MPVLRRLNVLTKFIFYYKEEDATEKDEDEKDENEKTEDETEVKDEDNGEGCLHKLSLVAKVGDKIESLAKNSLFRRSPFPICFSSLASSLSLYGG